MESKTLIEQELTHSIIGAFYEVYNTLGFGFHEDVYVMALERELLEKRHRVSREFIVRIAYKGNELTTQRLDMVVDEKVVVEIKSTYELHKAATRQVYSYLCATNLEVGLLLHFGPEPKFFAQVAPNGRNSRNSGDSAHSDKIEPSGRSGATSAPLADREPPKPAAAP